MGSAHLLNILFVFLGLICKRQVEMMLRSPQTTQRCAQHSRAQHHPSSFQQHDAFSVNSLGVMKQVEHPLGTMKGREGWCLTG